MMSATILTGVFAPLRKGLFKGCYLLISKDPTSLSYRVTVYELPDEASPSCLSKWFCSVAELREFLADQNWSPDWFAGPCAVFAASLNSGERL